jgi:hypothetical protein
VTVYESVEITPAPIVICATVCFNMYQGDTDLYEACGEECMASFDNDR